MRRLRTPLLYLIVGGAILTIGVAAGCGLSFRNPQAAPAQGSAGDLPPEFGVLTEVYSALSEDHYNRDEITPTLLSHGAIRGMLEALDDDHAAFLAPENYEAEQERFRGTFEGIGAEVSMRNGQVVVVAPIPNTPAEEAGIRSGDVILEVDGQSAEGLGVYDVVGLIRGPRGTQVTVVVLHRGDSSPTTLIITRGEVMVPTVEVRLLSGGIAHLEVQFFGENTTEEFMEALKRAERLNARGLILDLRDNPGGRVDTVVEMTSYFLNDGLALYYVDGHGARTDYPVTSGYKAPDIPVVVIVNEFSASSSEIMAGALRDHGRARLIGSTTFGKGSVNIQRSLSDGSGIYYSIARWFTPNGFLIEGEGIEPDIVVDADPAGVEDFPLDRAIETLSGVLALRV